MEKAGRRKLLLTGFMLLAVCNLLMTFTDAMLVRLTHLISIQKITT